MNSSFFSLMLLTSFLISMLSWLLIRTLKEGNKGLNEIRVARKQNKSNDKY